MEFLRIGTVDVPARVERERYFRELPYLELSALFAGPLKPSALARWAEVAPRGAIGLVAPSVMTHRKAPAAAKPWARDQASGDFRVGGPAREVLAPLRAAVDALGARCVVFRSSDDLSPSTANRAQLQQFFHELATAEAIGCERVWIPGGLWEPVAAVKLAGELGVTCAIDPLVREPGTPPEIYEDLEASALYLRVENAGRSGPLRTDRLEELAALIEHHSDQQLPLVVAFASPERWQDARKLKKLLDG